MEIVIAAVGKMKSGSAEAELVLHYVKQSRWQIKIVEVEEKRDLPKEARKKSEADLLLGAIKNTCTIVALDEHGREFTSLEFANNMKKWEECGDIAFIIGGADGLTDEVRAKAAVVMSMGKMTMPHFLARVMLAEQIYRARTIMDGHPYHRN